MIKNLIKRKLISCFLAGVLAVSVIDIVPPAEVYAKEIEEARGKRLFRGGGGSYDEENAYSGDDLGCMYTPEKTTFKVWSPEASSVVLCRFEAGNGGSAISETPMTKGDKGVWSAEVTGDIVNTYYTYKVTVDEITREAVDPYAKAAGVNGDRAMVVDLDSTDPKHWDKNYQREETLLSDMIVWEIHIRDFSIDVSSGVSEQNRGTYKAFTEKTTIDGEGRTASCVDYLKQLGVTHVQILPMYDFASVDETNVSTGSEHEYSWGYDPKNYNVPEGSYSSDPYDGNVRITEMKEMIQALHEAGIKVVMDVSYSHTSDAGDSNFNKIMPGYYYKLNDDLSYNDQSGYGNATRSDSAMFRKFMIDSVSYWAEEYHLDGFCFDLMGIHDVTTMNQIRAALDSKFGKNTIVLYGEGWTGNGEYDSNSAHKANESKLDRGIGYFNEQIKEALKGGDTFDGTIGLVQTGYAGGAYLEPGEKWPNNVFGGIMGSVGYTSGESGMWRPFWSKSSNCCLSYVSAHDQLTLWDKLAEGWERDFSSVDDRMIKMNKMAGSVVLVSKGGVFMQAGEEFARTKNGEDNSGSSSDAVNKIDWNRVHTYSDIQQYYQGMIRIRKTFSGFRSILERSSDNWAPKDNNIEWISKEEAGVTAFYETNDIPGEWNRIAVIINNAVSDQTVDLTASDEWVIVADGAKAGLEKIKESGSDITVPGKSVMVAVPKDTFDENHVSKNEPPAITCDTSFRVSSDRSLSFTVETSDPDGDAVTLEADGIPEGASFDAATGEFRWEDPAAGEYTLTLTARDKKTAVTKTVTIIVTLGLRDLIRQAEEKNYQKEDFTGEVYQVFENAFVNAKEVADRNETDEAKIQEALHDLKEAYEKINREAAAKEGLVQGLEKAKTRLAEAELDSANYEAEAAADLKMVISEAEEFIKMVHSAEEYQSVEEDLEFAVKACVYLKTNPVIRVKAGDWSDPAVYVWAEKGGSEVLLAGSWPGTKLTEKDPNGWFVFDLPQGTTGYSLIINGSLGGCHMQTDDIIGIAGSVDVTLSSEITKREYEVGGGVPQPDKTALGVQITKAEQLIIENPGSKYLPELKMSYDEAKKVHQNTDVSQVVINQSTRALKKSIKAVIEGSDPAEPSAKPSENPAGPSEIPVKPSQNPVRPSEIPVKPSQNPAKPSQNPVNPSGIPTKPSQNPAGPSQNPAKPSENPAKPSQNPAGPSQNPVNPSEIPTKPSQNPAGPSENPTKPSQIPVNPSQNPAKPSQIPAEPSEIPVKPSEIPTKPSTKPEESGGNPAGSGTESTKPGEEPLTEEPAKKLEITNMTIGKASGTAQVGDTITISVQSSGGTGVIKYRFLVKKSSSAVIGGESISSSTKWKPKKSGKYSITVYAKDDGGNVAEKTITKYTVNKKLKVRSFKASPSSKKARAGRKVKLMMKASGGTKKYLYKFRYKRSGTKKIKRISAYSSKKIVSWRPKKSGKYTLYVYVRDKKTKRTAKKIVRNYIVS